MVSGATEKGAGKPAPVPHSTTITPSGIEIEFYVEPKRMYRVRRVGITDDASVEPAPSDGWMTVPSVTEVLDVLDKPALTWWGMRVGLSGVLDLLETGVLVPVQAGEETKLYARGEMGRLVACGPVEVESLLKEHKLTTNHVRDKAGDRGQAVHDALEYWATTGNLPDPGLYPPEAQGYVKGLIEFLVHSGAEPLASEVMVGSAEHGFAGRYDVRIHIPKPAKVVFHRTPVKGPQWAEVAPGDYLADVKTSKDVYTSHSRQLEAYEAASIECGLGATEARGIINVQEDGTYKFVRSVAEFDDFLAVLGVWQSDQSIKQRSQTRKKGA